MGCWVADMNEGVFAGASEVVVFKREQKGRVARRSETLREQAGNFLSVVIIGFASV